MMNTVSAKQRQKVPVTCRIDGMDCSDCAAKIEKVVGGWCIATGANWRKEEIDNVLEYLNEWHDQSEEAHF